MGFFDLFGKKNVSEGLSKRLPYTLKTEFVPYRLKSKEQSSTILYMTMKNITGEPVLSSIVVELPRQLSFDLMGIAKQKELRLGTLAANEEKQVKAEIYGGLATDPGDYTLTLTAFVHYRDYAHVLNEMTKRTVVEVI